MPDESSNLKSPAAPPRSGGNRRRGRRGGRGRGPRPVIAKTGAPGSEEISPSTEPLEHDAPMADAAEHAEHHEGDTAGDFREPHAEAPADFASHETDSPEAPAAEPAADISRTPETRQQRDFPREPQRDRRPERRPEPLRPKPWVKPADFRPAETQCAAHSAASTHRAAKRRRRVASQCLHVRRAGMNRDRASLFNLTRNRRFHRPPTSRLLTLIEKTSAP